MMAVVFSNLRTLIAECMVESPELHRRLYWLQVLKELEMDTRKDSEQQVYGYGSLEGLTREKSKWR